MAFKLEYRKRTGADRLWRVVDEHRRPGGLTPPDIALRCEDPLHAATTMALAQSGEVVEWEGTKGAAGRIKNHYRLTWEED